MRIKRIDFSVIVKTVILNISRFQVWVALIIGYIIIRGIAERTGGRKSEREGLRKPILQKTWHLNAAPVTEPEAVLVGRFVNKIGIAGKP